MSDVIIKPAFVSTVPDTGDPTLVGPNAWNAPRLLSGGTAGDVVTADPLSTTGASWIPPGGAAQAVLTGTYAARPAAGTAGRLYLPNDGFAIARDTGTTWATFGPVYPLTAPPTGVWSWVNQGTSAITENKDALQLVGTAAGNTPNFVLRVKTTPATPYTVTAYLLASPIQKNSQNSGLCLRQNGAGSGQNRIRIFAHATYVVDAQRPGEAIACQGTAGATTALSDFPLAHPIAGRVPWFRINDNGTTLTYSISADGQNWLAIYSEARTAYLLQGPDQIGFFVNTQNGATPNVDVPLTILSWKEQ